jgi:hypothetical protein
VNELDAFQERLERKGWRFISLYLRGAEKFCWQAYKRDWGLSSQFVRPDRDDARRHALQYAEMSEGAVNECRDTIPAPSMEAAE